MGALSQIVKSGKALYVGLSNYDGTTLKEAIKILDNVENIRKEKGIKQSELAEKLGIMQSAYSRMITATDDIKLSTLQRIADILEVSLIDIIIYPDKYEKV